MAETNFVSGNDGVLNIKLLDGFYAKNQSDRALKISNRKACGLLCYLALSKTGVETRERLAGLLWSEHGESQARGSLRQCLRQLNSVFDVAGFTGLTSDRQNVSLKSDKLRIDILEIQEQFDAGSVHRDLKSQSGMPERLLYGYENLDRSFDAWLHVTRRNWHDRFIAQLQEMMKSTDLTEAKEAADAMLALDPTHEEAHRQIIRHHARSGNTSGALNQYKILWELLDGEFDIEPDLTTQDLIADVKNGLFEDRSHRDETVPVTAAPTPLAALPSRLPIIEIHPFLLGGPSDVEDYFIQGFRQELIACLVRFRDWVVTEAHGTAADGKNQTVADYKVEATYVTLKGKVLMTVTLADANSWRYIWSDRYTLSLEGWAQTQQKIAQRVAAALDIYLSKDGINRQMPKKDSSLEAYDLWLQGQNLLLDWRSSNDKEAENLFIQVIDIMPSFAPAYSSLANIYNTRHIVTAGYLRQHDLEEEALRLARRSIELDPLDHRTQLTLAWSYNLAERYEQASFHYELAQKLNGSDPQNLICSAQGLAFCGNLENAMRMSGDALKLNPTPAKFYWSFLASINFIGENYQAAIKASHNSGDALLTSAGWKAAAYAHTGQIEQAKLAGENFVSFIQPHWQGSSDCDAASVGEWFLQSFPIKSAKARKNLERGLRLAGFPV